MDCKDKLAATQILSVLLPYAYPGASYFIALMGARLVRLCLKFGLHKNCALGIVTMGWVLCIHNRKQGFQFGDVALCIVEKLRATEMIPRVHLPFYGFIHHWRIPLRDSLEPLKNVVRVGMETGEVDYAMMALYFVCTHSLHSGIPLRDVEKVFSDGVRQMRLYQQENMLKLTLPSLQFIHNLTGRAKDPKVLGGTIVNRVDMNLQTAALTVQGVFLYLEASLAFRFGDYERASQLSETWGQMNAINPLPLCTFIVTSQFEALAAVTCARNGLGSVKQQQVRVARRILKRFRAWSADCAENNLFRQYMLEAELLSLKRHKHTNPKIVKLFQQSIETSMRNGFVQESALANELAGDYLQRQGAVDKAKRFWKQARHLYLTWGATQKAAHLLTTMRARELDTNHCQRN